MALPHLNLDWIIHGEPAEGTYDPDQPQVAVAPVNRPTYQLLTNVLYLDEKFDSYASLSGAAFTGEVLVYAPVTSPKAVATKEYVDSLSARYTHHQSGQASTWVVNHNLGRIPVSVYIEINGEQAFADVVHVSVNQTLVHFSLPYSGLVYVT